MLQKLDQDRLNEVLALVEKHAIRFPVATLAKDSGKSKGEVSEYLKGKKPMSDNFYNAIIEHYEKSIHVKDAAILMAENQIELMASTRVILSILAEVQGSLQNRLPVDLASTYRRMVKDEARHLQEELRMR